MGSTPGQGAKIPFAKRQPKKNKSNDSSIFCLAPHLLTWNENTTPFLATVVRIRCYSDRTEGKAHFQGKMLTRMYR